MDLRHLLAIASVHLLLILPAAIVGRDRHRCLMARLLSCRLWAERRHPRIMEADFGLSTIAGLKALTERA